MAILDLIEHVDEDRNEIAFRVPQRGSGEFRLGSQCVVRESQRAVFMRDGKALDVLPPGRHTLSTANIPILTDLLSIPFGSKSPFRAEVYFVSMREFTDMKWGTQQPVVFRDKEFGMVRIRAFGTYSMQVQNPQQLLTQVVGTRPGYYTSDIEEFLRSNIVNEFNDMLGATLTTLLDVPAMSMELATAAQHSLTDNFERLGLELRTFQINAITPPDEVQQRIDQRSSMGALGDMGRYTQFQTAEAIGRMGGGGDGEGGGGGTMADGAGLGAGLGMGMAMSEAIRDSIRGRDTGTASQGPTTNVEGGGFCPECGQPVPAGAKFCPSCGHNLRAGTTCPKCGTTNATGARFCQECGESLAT